MRSKRKSVTLGWTPAAWEDYAYWQVQDRKTLKRINLLITDCLRNPFEGIGKPEPLKENLSGLWSRRIDDTHRLIYSLEDGVLVVIACRYHYE
jgi:toxin YoeB